MAEDLPSVSIPHSDEVELNRVNCLVWILHESARSFSLAIQNQPLARSGPELSNAWIGVDVHLWHKRMAYQESFLAISAALSVEKLANQDIEETTLATLGIFAFLGRETRLFLSEMNIKDLDEQIKDFLSYLVCGSLVYMSPLFNSLPEYQLFIVVAEKEIILYTVLTVCYDVFSGYAHYSNSSQQPMDKKLLSILLQSQTLLSYCLEEYWAAYDKSGESMKFSERVPSDSTPSVPTNKAITNSSILLEAQQNPVDLMKRRSSQDGSTIRK
ncbi:hypothetical protein Tco_1018101, partial [Tanacetum coccineum]